MAASTKVCEPTAILRRSGNYKPCSWGLDYLLSLKNNFTSEFYTQRAEGLKGDVKVMLGNVVEPLSQFELIDDLQRLGLSYHFVEEIRDMLNNIYSKISNIHEWTKSDLHATALAFRLLRQHNYHIHEEIFKKFKDEKGNFKISLCDDVKGMLSLYEASYLSTEGEIIMEEAYQFTSKRLKDLKGNVVELYLGMLVSHALEVPLHWNVLRAEARWFIDVYEKRSDMNPTLLELAKLDFNIVQGLYQEELRDVARWWKNIGLQEKISFSKDSLINAFFWTMGAIFEPKFGYCRTTLAKFIQLITVLDDMYDVYGTVDELELFTDAIERWDSISAMKQLPDYMKICYLAVYHNVHEWAYDILKEHGFDALSSIKKTYSDILKAYLIEARWYHTGYMPKTLEEYMNNAARSMGYLAVVTQCYIFSVSNVNPLTERELTYLESNPDVLHWNSVINRLDNDLGTSSAEMQRGDVPKAVQCYMYETGISENVARDHLKEKRRDAWKKVNKYRVESSPLSQTTIDIMMNLTRTTHSVYQRGDGHGAQNRETKIKFSRLLFDPIPL